MLGCSIYSTFPLALGGSIPPSAAWLPVLSEHDAVGAIDNATKIKEMSFTSSKHGSSSCRETHVMWATVCRDDDCAHVIAPIFFIAIALIFANLFADSAINLIILIQTLSTRIDELDRNSRPFVHMLGDPAHSRDLQTCTFL